MGVVTDNAICHSHGCDLAPTRLYTWCIIVFYETWGIYGTE